MIEADSYRARTNTVKGAPRKFRLPMSAFQRESFSFRCFFLAQKKKTHQLKANQDRDIQVCSIQHRRPMKWKTAGRRKPQNVSNYRSSSDCSTTPRHRMLCTAVPFCKWKRRKFCYFVPTKFIKRTSIQQQQSTNVFACVKGLSRMLSHVELLWMSCWWWWQDASSFTTHANIPTAP